MKRHLLRHLAGTMGYEPDEKSIRWVLTVPAIWDENAKQFMREAAHKVINRVRDKCYFIVYS